MTQNNHNTALAPWILKEGPPELLRKLDEVPQPPNVWVSIIDENHVMWPFTKANGLCSTMDVFAHDIVHTAKWCVENDLPCPRVNWSNTLGVYGEDIHSKLFKPNNEISLETYASFDAPRVTATGAVIHSEEIKVLRQVANDWFKPVDVVTRIKNQFKKQYNFNPNKGACAYYRGADKIKETSLPSYRTYVEPIRNIKRDHPEITDFLIQSDDPFFQDHVYKPFENNVIIEQLNENIDHANRGTGCHFIGTQEYRERHVRMFLAALFLMSECKHIIIPSTNAGRWICALNDSERNITQLIMHANWRPVKL